jgi:hypothetical protein
MSGLVCKCGRTKQRQPLICPVCDGGSPGSATEAALRLAVERILLLIPPGAPWEPTEEQIISAIRGALSEPRNASPPPPIDRSMTPVNTLHNALTRQAYELCLKIEEFPASEQQTRCIVAASDLLRAIYLQTEPAPIESASVPKEEPR